MPAVHYEKVRPHHAYQGSSGLCMVLSITMDADSIAELIITYRDANQGLGVLYLSEFRERYPLEVLPDMTLAS
jgi:hypothetical protein